MAANEFDFDSHRRDAEAEDVEFLMTRGGLSLEAACERVGVKPTTLERRVSRHRADRELEEAS